MGAAASVAFGIPHLLKTKYLSQTPGLAQLNEQQLNDLARCFAGHKVARGTVFEATSQHPETDVYLVGTGELELHTIVPVLPSKGQSADVQLQMLQMPAFEELVLCNKQAGQVVVTTPYKNRLRLYSMASRRGLSSAAQSHATSGRPVSNSLGDGSAASSSKNRGFSVPVYTLQARATQDTMLLLLKRNKVPKFLATWPGLSDVLRTLTDINLVDLLHHLPFLKGVPDPQLLLLNSIVTMKVYQRGVRVIAEGEVGDTMHMLISGRCAVMAGGPKASSPASSHAHSRAATSQPASASASPRHSGKMTAHGTHSTYTAPGTSAMDPKTAASLSAPATVTTSSLPVNVKPPQLVMALGKAIARSMSANDDPSGATVSESAYGSATTGASQTGSPQSLTLAAIAKALGRSVGKNTLHSDQGANTEKMLSELEPGAYFGETALVVEVPRTSSVDMLEDGIIATITKVSFTIFVKMCPQVMTPMQEVLKMRALQNLSQLDSLLFRGLPPEVLQPIATQCDVKYVKEDEQVLYEGHKCSTMYLVVAGQVQVVSPPKSNKPDAAVQTWLLGRGEYFAAGSMLSGQPRPSSVISTKQSLLLVITQEILQILLDHSPALKAELTLVAMPRQATLDDILCLRVARTALRQFQRSQFASENIDFWEAVTEYSTSRPAARAIRANDVLERFISEHSKEQVNIDMKMREAIISQVEEGHYTDDLFASAKAEVFKIMERDSLPRFVCSDIFAALLADIGRDEHF